MLLHVFSWTTELKDPVILQDGTTPLDYKRVTDNRTSSFSCGVSDVTEAPNITMTLSVHGASSTFKGQASNYNGETCLYSGAVETNVSLSQGDQVEVQCQLEYSSEMRPRQVTLPPGKCAKLIILETISPTDVGSLQVNESRDLRLSQAHLSTKVLLFIRFYYKGFILRFCSSLFYQITSWNALNIFRKFEILFPLRWIHDSPKLGSYPSYPTKFPTSLFSKGKTIVTHQSERMLPVGNVVPVNLYDTGLCVMTVSSFSYFSNF